MLPNKKSYFQGGGGVNEPTPKKKKYKSEKSIVVQPRFEEPFYRNYDLYDVGGKHGPGTGAYHSKHKSVKDFLKEKSKNKEKYKANDSWNEGSEKKDRSRRMKLRANLLYGLTKFAIDYDNDYLTTPIDENPDGNGYTDISQFGGLLDAIPLTDFEGKTIDHLNFGRDYDQEVAEDLRNTSKDLKDLAEDFYTKYEKFLNAKEPDLFGLPDGFEPGEDLDSDKTKYTHNPEYGTTDSGNTLYSKI